MLIGGLPIASSPIAATRGPIPVPTVSAGAFTILRTRRNLYIDEGVYYRPSYTLRRISYWYTASLNDISATGTISITGDANLTAIGSLSAAGSIAITGAANLTGVGALSAAGTIQINGDANLRGIGNLSAAGTLQINGDANLRGIGNLSAAGTIQINGDANLRGIGNLSATGTLEINGYANLTDGSSNNMSATGTIEITGSANLTAIGRLIAQGTIEITGSANLTDGAQPVSIVGLGGGGSVWYQGKRRKKRRDLNKELESLIDVEAKELYRKLTGKDAPPEVRQEAALIVKPYVETKRAAVPKPTQVDWNALNMEADRVAALVRLWRQEQDRIADEEWFMLGD